MYRDIADQHDRDDLAAAVRESPHHARTDVAAAMRRIVADHSAARVGGVYVDMTTASVIVRIGDALNEKNRETFFALPVRRMVDVAWKLASRCNRG